jgi:hypothetical protein
MKFKQPNGSAIETLAITVVGVAVGAMASRAAMGAIHTDATKNAAGVALTAAELKTQTLTKYGKRAAILAGAGYAAAGIDGKDTAGAFAKAAAIGASTIQLIDGVKDFAADNTTLQGYATGTKTQKAIAKAVGLGCACDSPALLAMPLNRPRHRRLASPVDNYLPQPARPALAGSYQDAMAKNYAFV